MAIKIDTAINFAGEKINGFVRDDLLNIKGIFGSEVLIEEVSKEEVSELILELQTIYSTMSKFEKQKQKVNEPVPRSNSLLKEQMS